MAYGYQIAPGEMLREKTVLLEDAFNPKTIREWCESRTLSSASLFKAAWSIALGAYAGAQDTCFGAQIGGEHHLFRCHLDSTQPVEALLNSTEEVTVTDKFQSLNERSSVLFDTVLHVVEDDFDSPPGEDTMNGEAHSVSNGVPCNSFLSGPLLHVKVPVKDGKLVLVYPSVVWTQIQATRAGQLLSRCITELVANHDRYLRDIDWLPSSQAQTISDWNKEDFDNYEFCIPNVIARRTAEAPNNMAVCAWDGDFTYQELDRFASQLAQKLCGSGVCRNDVIPFLFHKSKWTIVAVLAILKTGGAATALNPEFSQPKLKSILDFTKSLWLLVGNDLRGTLDLPNLTEIVVDDQLFFSSSDISSTETFASPTLQPEDLAFIQFTSGSTGEPKGVMIEHRTYVANALSQQVACSVDSGSRVLQFASHNFDAILVEILTTLMAGACVCVPSEEDRMGNLAGVINDLKVNWMGITPTLAKVLSPADVPGLKTLVFWGESATPELVEAWADSLQLINVYGPSENSVEATSYCFSAGISRDPSHIGKAMKGVNTWIARTDNRQWLAPIGAVGELVLQGPTVARGYLHDPTRSQESFKNGAHWLPLMMNRLHQRLYYTGDLARYTVDGSVEILGRSDTQVKIRGHRIELGDIEHHIHQSPGRSLSSVVEVISPSFRPAQKTLVAFVSEQNVQQQASSLDGFSLLLPSSDRTRGDATNLHDHLSTILPSYSVPSLYIPLISIPTTATGKSDRKKLRDLASSLREAEFLKYSYKPSVMRTPTTAVEVLAAQLWAEILGLDARSVSLDDSFFWLGGDSILAMRLAVAARARGMSITVAQILQKPRLADFVSAVEEQKSSEPKPPLPRAVFSSLPHVETGKILQDVVYSRLGVQLADVEDVAVATDYQIENLAWCSLKQRGGTNYITFDFSSESLDPGRLQAACERLVSYHAILRTVYFVYQRYVYQVVLKQLPFEIVRCFHVRDVSQATSAIMAKDLAQPLDIAKSLVKFWLLEGDGGVKRLILRASHAQYDGVTLIRWCKELGLAYGGRSLYPTASFPGYMYLAAKHDEQGARAFWRKLLAGSSMTNVISHSGVQYKHVLDVHVEAFIESTLVRSHADITVGTTIKAAWALVLAEMAGVSDVVFGSVVMGRNAAYPGVENVAGTCIDNIPVRVTFTPDMTRLKLLQLVQEQYFEAVNFESFQYKRIVSDCTDWKPWERLSTLVEYENLGEESSRFEIDGHSSAVDEIRPPADRHDITIWSTSIGKQTFIALWFCKALIPQRLAQQMLDRLIFHIAAFKNNVHAPIVVAQPGENILPRIPMSIGTNSQYSDTRKLQWSENDTGVKKSIRTLLQGLVDQAWLNVLLCEQSDLATYRQEKTPFFHVWGNLVAALGLAQYYTEAGFCVSMEDILENVDMMAQLDMIHNLV